MVLLASAVLTKGGKTLLSRQFVEMTKSRVEGLLAAFPKLLPSGNKQHTFVETESVRYVYQPMEKLYMVLITTKASNILEDLETLRLFSKVVGDYCKSFEESDIFENAFNLIFAFDEIVALGYRESVNLAQVRTFVEMDSHEEKVFQAVRQSQERDAKQKMREKAKELQRQKLESSKRGYKGGISSSGGYSISSSDSNITPTIVNDSNNTPVEPIRPSYQKSVGSSKALKLGGKSKDVEFFVDQLKSEGEKVASLNKTIDGKNSYQPTSQTITNSENIHLRIEEKIMLTAGRDGGLQNMEVHGMTTLRVQDEAFGLIRIQIDNQDNRGIQLQTHPNVDKELFKSKNQVGLKNPNKPFPINTDVGVLKWRYQTNEESQIPLLINCWPSENGSGGCDVNIEYELQNENLELMDVIIAIPLPAGCGSPIVGDCEGEYLYDSRRNTLLWQLAVLGNSNKTGAMEFSVSSGKAFNFFPVQVNFVSNQSFARISIIDVLSVESETPVKHSVETSFVADKYEII